MVQKFDIEKSPNTFRYVLEHDTGNLYCNCCNSLVLKNNRKEYPYQCMSCDEDLTEQFVHSGNFHDTKQLEEVLKCTELVLCLDD